MNRVVRGHNNVLLFHSIVNRYLTTKRSLHFGGRIIRCGQIPSLSMVVVCCIVSWHLLG